MIHTLTTQVHVACLAVDARACSRVIPRAERGDFCALSIQQEIVILAASASACRWTHLLAVGDLRERPACPAGVEDKADQALNAPPCDDVCSCAVAGKLRAGAIDIHVITQLADLTALAGLAGVVAAIGVE